jgi:hypothetical protein
MDCHRPLRHLGRQKSKSLFIHVLGQSDIEKLRFKLRNSSVILLGKSRNGHLSEKKNSSLNTALYFPKKFLLYT